MHPAVGLQPLVLGPSSCLVQRALAHAQHARSLLAPWLRHERNRCNQRWDAWAWAWAWRLGGLGLGFPGEHWSLHRKHGWYSERAWSSNASRKAIQKQDMLWAWATWQVTSKAKGGQRLTFRTGSLASFQLLKHASCLLRRSLYLTSSENSGNKHISSTGLSSF
jgi:hypothetical protein